MNSRSSRARPLPREDRRAAILDAVVPLLIENGASVTTAEMAAAAGIAEGTVFRAFADKASLLHAAIERTLDPVPIAEEMTKVDRSASLDAQLASVGDILTRQFKSVAALIGMLRSLPHDDKPHAEAHRIANESMAAVADLVTELLEPHRASLRLHPAQVAVLLRGLVFTNTHHLLSPDDRMTNEQLVDALLGGVALRGTT